MAWPYDARYQTYSANQQVLSDELNEYQDKIIDLYKAQTDAHILMPMQNIIGSGWNSGIESPGTTVTAEMQYLCAAGNSEAVGNLSFSEIPSGATLSAVYVDWKQTGSAGAGHQSRIYVRRHVKAATSGAAKTIQLMDGTGYVDNPAYDSARKWTYLTLSTNNTAWNTGFDHLCITLMNADHASSVSEIFNIWVVATWNGLSKYITQY